MLLSFGFVFFFSCGRDHSPTQLSIDKEASAWLENLPRASSDNNTLDYTIPNKVTPHHTTPHH
jgi:hypothetical protein